MITQRKIQNLKNAGVLEEIIVPVKALIVRKSRPGDGVGPVLNILHVCMHCGRAFDKYGIHFDHITLCSHCVNAAPVQKFFYILQQEVSDLIKETELQTHIKKEFKAKLLEALMKLINK